LQTVNNDDLSSSERLPAEALVARRIVLCHLESLCGLPALNHLFEVLGGEIGLVIASRRFGGRQGGVWRQLVASARRSGLRLTIWWGFDIVGAQIADRLARLRRLVVARPPRLGTLPALARRHGARLVEVDDINAESTLALLGAYAPDIIIVMNFDQILRAPAIATPRIGVLNIHPSLLPSLRGPCPAFWALATLGRESGVTIHRIEDERIDAGRILVQRRQLIQGSPSVGELTTALFLAGAQALTKALSRLAADASCGEPQVPGDGDYRGFPARADAAAARKAGVRCFAFRHIAGLFWASVAQSARRP